MFGTTWTAARHASLSFALSWSLLKFVSIELVILSNHLILCLPSFLLPSIFPSTRFFLSESALCIRWPEYWSFSFSINSSNEYSGLISFRTDWFGLLTVQGTVFNAIVQRHQFFGPQHFYCHLSHIFMTTRKTIPLTIWTIVGKIMPAF